MKEFVISEAKAESAILVGLITKDQDEAKTKEYLDELEFLADTAGAVTVKRYTQRVGGPSQTTYVGKGKLEEIRNYIKKRKDTQSNKEQNVFKDMRIVLEMYARGFDFMPLDIYRAHPNRFLIIDGKLMPAINSIDGLGDNAAIYISEAAKDGPFLSKDDFRERTHVSRSAVDLKSD